MHDTWNNRVWSWDNPGIRNHSFTSFIPWVNKGLLEWTFRVRHKGGWGGTTKAAPRLRRFTGLGEKDPRTDKAGHHQSPFWGDTQKK